MLTGLAQRADCIDGVESARKHLADLAQSLSDAAKDTTGASRAKEQVDSAWRLLGYAVDALTHI